MSLEKNVALKKQELRLNSKMEVIYASKKERLSAKQIMKKFNIGKTQYYNIMKTKDKKEKKTG